MSIKVMILMGIALCIIVVLAMWRYSDGGSARHHQGNAVKNMSGIDPELRPKFIMHKTESDLLKDEAKHKQYRIEGSLDGPDNESDKVLAVDYAIPDNRAKEIAREAIGPIQYYREGSIDIERKDGIIHVRFPVNKEVPIGTRYRGPDYAAEVQIEAKTGKVLHSQLGG